jgi:uncharacterized protein
MTAKQIIEHLHMLPHPEGGYYKETYRSADTFFTQNGETRNIGTAIYYLLENEDKSHFHRLTSDELWFFHQGTPIEIFCIEENKMVVKLLGNDLANGANPQWLIPADTWFAARVQNSSGFALVSCTVSPGFDFKDFEMAERVVLLNQYPHLTEVIHSFTKGSL